SSLTIDYAFKAQSKRPCRFLGLQFTERMCGHFVARDISHASISSAAAAQSTMELILTIASDHLDDMLINKLHPAKMIGTIACPTLSDRPLTVTNGRFNLFIGNQHDPRIRHIRYRANAHATTGKVFYFDGKKIIKNGWLRNVWRETTTLYFTVRETEEESAPILGEGVLHVGLFDFLKELTTLQVTNTPSI